MNKDLDLPGRTVDNKLQNILKKIWGWKVPEVLTSGNHVEIEKWRKKKTQEKSKK